MLHRPEPVLRRPGAPVDRRTSVDAAARRLIAGETLVVRDDWGTGLRILEALGQRLNPPPPTAGFHAKRRWHDALAEHGQRLLVPVKAGRVALRGAPMIGFLLELYAELDRFWLPVPACRELEEAWVRYDGGVKLAVLGFPLHPFYGAYLPKRTTHLELFATWLSGWGGERRVAVDVGTGSGVLAMMLARAGFAQVHATDINPNACESARRDLVRRPTPLPVTVHEADLLDGLDVQADLIVFNPPWTQGPVESLLDRALHYEGDLFERFFAQAEAKLAPGGRVVLVFSNVIRLVQKGVPHPIDAVVEAGRWELIGKQTRRIKPTGRQARRTKEKVEVWELGLGC